MYQLVYYYKETTGSKIIEEKPRKLFEFRLRRNALHFLFEIIQNEYREKEYGTEQMVGGISCYKSEKTESGERKIIEVKIKVEKA